VKLIDRIYTPELREQMAQLPSGAFPKIGRIGIKFGRRGDYFVIELPEPIFALYIHYGSCTVLNDDDPLTVEYTAVKHSDETIRDAKAKARAVIWAATTNEKLIATWPEIAQFVPHVESVTLPAIRIEDLNKELKL
jgi:hypothetical protein